MPEGVALICADAARNIVSLFCKIANIIVLFAITKEVCVMSEKICGLDKLLKNQSGIVVSLENKGALRRRLQDMGIICGSRIECVGQSPFGNPKAHFVKGTCIALRNDDAAKIKIEKMEKNNGKTGKNQCDEIA